MNPFDIKQNLEYMMISSCNCLTKTPDPQYHVTGCRYRQLRETLKYIEQLEDELARLTEDKPR